MQGRHASCQEHRGIPMPEAWKAFEAQSGPSCCHHFSVPQGPDHRSGAGRPPGPLCPSPASGAELTPISAPTCRKEEGHWLIDWDLPAVSRLARDTGSNNPGSTWRSAQLKRPTARDFSADVDLGPSVRHAFSSRPPGVGLQCMGSCPGHALPTQVHGNRYKRRAPV